VTVNIAVYIITEYVHTQISRQQLNILISPSAFYISSKFIHNRLRPRLSSQAYRSSGGFQGDGDGCSTPIALRIFFSFNRFSRIKRTWFIMCTALAMKRQRADWPASSFNPFFQNSRIRHYLGRYYRVIEKGSHYQSSNKTH